MSGIWIYSEDINVAKEMVTLAKELAEKNNQVIGAVTLNEEAAQELAGLGVSKVIVMKGSSDWAEAYDRPLTELLQAEGAEIVLIGGTVSGKYMAARAAARLNAGLGTDAVKVAVEEKGIVIDRIIYGGLAVSTDEIAFPAFVTIPPHTYEAAAAGAVGEVTVKEVQADTAVTVEAVTKIEHRGVDITKADKVVGVGRGIAKQEDVALAEQLAHAIGAEMACTRPVAEDAKWMPIDQYIGISGKSIKGSLYIAVGASGQIQHVAGIRDVKTIVAINSDESAPIFGAADYGIVGDYAAVVPALVGAIEKVK